MAKLKLLIDKSFDSPETLFTNFNKLLSNNEERNNDYFYVGIKLARFETIRVSVCNYYTQTITNITSAMEERFDNLHISPIFKHLVPLLDVSTWPTDPIHFGEDRIQEIAKYFNETLIYNKCLTEDLQREWIVLKTIVKPIYENDTKAKYLDIWEHIFTNEEIVKECDNILHLIEILLITPFSTRKLERMFFRMLRVKNDLQNKLGRDRLEALLRNSEEGPSIENFNPDIATESWYNEKVKRLSAGPHNYPKKRKTSEMQSTFLSMITLSDLESEDEDI